MSPPRGDDDRRRGEPPAPERVLPFRRRTGIAAARVYSPRGMTLRESAQRDAELGGRVPNPRATAADGRRRPDPAASKPRADKPRADKPRADKPRADKPRADKPRADKPRRPQPERERGQAAADRQPRRGTGQTRGAGQPRTRTQPRTTTRQRSAAAPRRATSEHRDYAPAVRRPKRPVRTGAPQRRQRRLRVPRLGNPTRRLRFALSVVLALFAVLAGRLVQIQAYEGTAYAAQAAAAKTRSVVLLAPRGAIVDRHGNELALSVDAVYIDGDPTLVKDPVKVAHGLSGLIGVPESELVQKLSKTANEEGKPIRFVYLARRRDPQVGQAVLAADLPGIYVRKEQRRDVPGADLAANIVGFVGADGKGLAGIEESYDSVLRGTDGRRSYERGLHGQQIPDGKDVLVPAKPGHDVQLTIDWDLQYQAQKLLGMRMKEMPGGTGAVVVQDVQTGEIMAMASYPSYDAKDPSDSTAKTRTDVATGAVIEPGSVHKVITIGAALEEGKIHADDTFPIDMTVEKGHVTYKDTHEHGHINITLQGILAESSNVGTIAIADKLGADKLYEYQRAFGLGSKVGIGLPGESAGLVQPPKNWSGPSYGSIPIGLGVAVTPLQMTSVFTTIANDGVRIPPKLVRATIDDRGTVSPIPSGKPQRVMSVENARILRSALEAVPTKYGTAKLAAIPNYRVAGKTGTGLRVENDHYMPGNVASFVGILPADAPRYVIGVFLHGVGSSSSAVASPLFSELGKFLLQLYAIPPSGSAPPPIRISVP